MPFQEFDGTIPSWVASGWGVMVPAKDSPFDCFVWRHHYFSVPCIQSFLVLGDFPGSFPVFHQGAMTNLQFHQFLEESFPGGICRSYEDVGGKECQVRVVVLSLVC